MYDTNGTVYLDFTSGIAVNALGHADPQLAKVISAQAHEIIHLSNLFHHPSQAELASKLMKTFDPDSRLKRVFFCNSGTEANEAAIKFARRWAKSSSGDKDKYKIISFKGAFHGRTMGALSATPNEKYQEPFSPMVPGFVYAEWNDLVGVEEELVEGAVAAVLVEPIQGEGGINIAKPEFLRGLRQLCDKHNALLIFDEIQV